MQAGVQHQPHPDGDAFDSGPFESRTISAPDGLRLHVRDYQPNDGPHGAAGGAVDPPVVCLHGLARTAADFHELAMAIAHGGAPRRRVIVPDYRGRGRSEYDRNPANYNPAVELADLLAVLTAFDLPPAVFVGTSRGGILAMLLAAARPGMMTGVVLNDIGPVIEQRGLVRIKGYVGKLPSPKSFEEGAEILRRLGDAQFPNLSADGWMRQARRTWMRRNGHLVLAYDPNLSRVLEDLDLEQPAPAMWPQFDALARVPVMVIRGAKSDILSAATVEAMRARRLDLDVVEVADEGHAPLLVEPGIIKRIAGFVTLCELAQSH